jgi:glycosyltransferase involved in cell wall biosynthesis
MHRGIVVNARFLHRQISGVERYAGEILSRLDDCVRRIDPGIRLSGFGGHVWEQLILPAQVSQGDILWSPANTGPLALSNQVITLHDTCFIDHPEWYHSSFASWYNLLIPKLVHRARLVTTASSYAKIRIVEAFRIYENKVEVVPGGVDTQKFKPKTSVEVNAVRKKYDLLNPYVLVVGSMHPRKNLVNLFSAWKAVRRSYPDVILLVAGAREGVFTVNGNQEIPAGVRLVGYLDDADLPALYSGAAAYVLASLYEGFGLTVLEAMACGTPVIAANTTALPEVVGKAGRLFNPLDIDELATAIDEVLSDDWIAKDLIQKGYQQAKLFNWEQSAYIQFALLERELNNL